MSKKFILVSEKVDLHHNKSIELSDYVNYVKAIYSI